MDSKVNIHQYIIEFFLNEETPEGCMAMDKWLNESDQNRQLFNEYKRIWAGVRSIYKMEQFDANVAWHKVNTLNYKNTKRQRVIKNIVYISSGIAATILLFVGLLWSGVLYPSHNYNMVMETEYGNRSQMQLPDGTKVNLNSGSHIGYNYNSKNKIREVSFQGEALFEVAQKEEPFIITTSDGMRLKVLGTTFNLQAYDNDSTIQTTLLEGRVELCKSQKKILMLPGETVVYNKITGDISYLQKEPKYIYGWINDKIYMEDMSLREVAKLLERKYNVKIHLQKGLENIRYNGVIKEKSINDVLEALTILSDIGYYISNNEITLFAKPDKLK